MTAEFAPVTDSRSVELSHEQQSPLASNAISFLPPRPLPADIAGDLDFLEPIDLCLPGEDRFGNKLPVPATIEKFVAICAEFSASKEPESKKARTLTHNEKEELVELFGRSYELLKLVVKAADEIGNLGSEKRSATDTLGYLLLKCLGGSRDVEEGFQAQWRGVSHWSKPSEAEREFISRQDAVLECLNHGINQAIRDEALQRHREETHDSRFSGKGEICSVHLGRIDPAIVASILTRQEKQEALFRLSNIIPLSVLNGFITQYSSPEVPLAGFVQREILPDLKLIRDLLTQESTSQPELGKGYLRVYTQLRQALDIDYTHATNHQSRLARIVSSNLLSHFGPNGPGDSGLMLELKGVAETARIRNEAKGNSSEILTDDQLFDKVAEAIFVFGHAAKSSLLSNAAVRKIGRWLGSNDQGAQHVEAIARYELEERGFNRKYPQVMGDLLWELPRTSLFTLEMIPSDWPKYVSGNTGSRDGGIGMRTFSWGVAQYIWFEAVLD